MQFDADGIAVVGEADLALDCVASPSGEGEVGDGAFRVLPSTGVSGLRSGGPLNSFVGRFGLYSVWFRIVSANVKTAKTEAKIDPFKRVDPDASGDDPDGCSYTQIRRVMECPVGCHAVEVPGGFGHWWQPETGFVFGISRVSGVRPQWVRLMGRYEQLQQGRTELRLFPLAAVVASVDTYSLGSGHGANRRV